ncbi:MAG TPA: class I SAM-dependent methyltransferase [Vicinamibacterales bacterium]|nr:class I SAM-dependent methyltransferase [Vicinamibacterales bacterium]
MTDGAILRLNFPECLAGSFPADLPAAVRAVDCVLDAVKGRDVVSLAAHSPELAAFDWPGYLRCSIARMAHIAAALRRRGIAAGRLLDYGSYFGNFSLMFAGAGFHVDAVDGYRAYGSAFAPMQDLMRQAGVTLHDFESVGRDLHDIPADTYDVVLCLGVIEHVPHTPRLLLQSLTRVLKPGGCLVIDTPNHAYLYHRQRLMAGESVMANIAAQFRAEPPFEGHHREYTPSEVAWMLEQSGQCDVSLELFNYSVYALSSLTGTDLANYWAMALDPTSRELIMAVSIKTDTASAGDRPMRSPDDVRALIEETEQAWVDAVPPDLRALRSESAADAGRRKLEEYYVGEVARRDREIAEAHEQIGALQRERDRRLMSRLARLWRR